MARVFHAAESTRGTRPPPRGPVTRYNSSPVITGYNTDVKHNNRVFYIQTEDKGDSSPHIESLVYVGGQILATRKTSYADLVGSGRDDKAVQELMEQQHRTMIAAIQRGRFDGPNGSLESPEGADEEEEEPSAAAGAAPASAGDRTLDQVILDYLASELALDQIDCSFSPVPDFVAGREAAIRMRALSSLSKQPVAGAAVSIRVSRPSPGPPSCSRARRRRTEPVRCRSWCRVRATGPQPP